MVFLSTETQDVILTFDWTKSDAETNFTVSTGIILILISDTNVQNLDSQLI